MTTADKLEALRSLLESEQQRGLVAQGYNLDHHCWQVRVKMGRKYANLDVGGPHWSGRYMVDIATGEIFGIKAYGVIHRGHRYGTLDTIAAFDWSNYTARQVA